MPTGYTQNMYEGKQVSKEEFIWNCARAFGALTAMRDEPFDAKVPEAFEPSSYYLQQIERKKKELDTFFSLSLTEIEQQLEEAYARDVTYRQELLKEKRELKQRYEAMLTEIEAWQPPTEDHVNLKTFCLNQLNESIEFDCGSIAYYEDTHVEKPTVDAWLFEQKQTMLKDIERYQQQWEDEQERVEKRNQWVRALRNSL